MSVLLSPELLQKKRSIIEFYLSRKVLLSREKILKLQSVDGVEQEFAAIKNDDGMTMEAVDEFSPSLPILSSSSSSSVVPSSSLLLPSSNYSLSVDKEFFFEKSEITVKDFLGNMMTRFRALEKMLQSRSELVNLTSFHRLKDKSERETVSLIGMVYEKSETKNGNIVFSLEDFSGSFKVIVSKNSPAFSTAQDTGLDEVIGVCGSLGKDVLFANTVIYPDVPLLTEVKKAPDEVYAVVLSDIHIGSKLFLPDRFQNCISWLKGEFGSPEQREIAKKVGYVFIVGDLIDGVGVFPNQLHELAIPDIYEQYAEAAKFISQIPLDKKIIYSPGNHDAMRLVEPQPRLYEHFAKPLFSIPNLTLTTNPSWVTIHKSDDFPGFRCLLYHGLSYVFYGDNTTSIRESGLNISDRTGIIMKYLLQRRHLAPVYSSSRTGPNPIEDCHVIDQVPDFFLSGHIHKAVLLNYRGVSLVCGSCFQSNSEHQEKFGHTPIPGQVPLINLKTRVMTLVEF